MLIKDVHVGNNIPSSTKDGVDIINLFNPSTDIGKLLSPFNIDNGTEFLKWKFYSTKSLMDFLRLDSYKEEWLAIKNHNTKLKKTINSLRPINRPAYWGIIILFIIKKVQNNKNLREAILNNNLDFNMYMDSNEEIPILGTTMITKKKMENFHGYCVAVTFVSMLLKKGILDGTKKEDEILKDILVTNFPDMMESIKSIIA